MLKILFMNRTNSIIVSLIVAGTVVANVLGEPVKAFEIIGLGIVIALFKISEKGEE